LPLINADFFSVLTITQRDTELVPPKREFFTNKKNLAPFAAKIILPQRAQDLSRQSGRITQGTQRLSRQSGRMTCAVFEWHWGTPKFTI
jgi:hypothetical protein